MRKHRTSLEFPLHLWRRLCSLVPARKRSNFIIQALREKLWREALKVFILCGGEGTRMRPLTLTIPKPMLPVGYKPLLHRTIEWLKAQGFYNFVLGIGYLGEHIIKYFGDGSRFGVEIKYSSEEHALGTGGALKHAENLLGSTFIMLNGDVVFSGLDVNEVLRFHRRNRAQATMVLTRVTDARRFGLVKTNEDGRVVEFEEKPKSVRSGWINAGLYVLENSVFKLIPPHRTISLEERIFPILVEEGRFFAYKHKGYWADLGIPSDYEKVCRDFFEGKLG
jgi:mannose-1-phosphate guanylyltransferase